MYPYSERRSDLAWAERLDDRISALQSLASETPEVAKFKLTAKETQVIAAVLEGDTNKAIAERLSISDN